MIEAQTLCTLFHSVEHAIFIGDPQQLRSVIINISTDNSTNFSDRPLVSEQSLSLETASGKNYRLDESLFERMMFPSAPGVQPLATSRLNLQRRMHPDIANIMRATLYPFLQVFRIQSPFGITDIKFRRIMSPLAVMHPWLAWLSVSGG